jgi:hypothetical protein
MLANGGINYYTTNLPSMYAKSTIGILGGGGGKQTVGDFSLCPSPSFRPPST